MDEGNTSNLKGALIGTEEFLASSLEFPELRKLGFTLCVP